MRTTLEQLPNNELLCSQQTYRLIAGLRFVSPKDYVNASTLVGCTIRMLKYGTVQEMKVVSVSEDGVSLLRIYPEGYGKKGGGFNRVRKFVALSTFASYAPAILEIR